MSGTRAALQAVADDLVAQGVNITTDPRALYPPALLLERPANRVPTMTGTELTVSAWAVVPAPWDANAWDALDALVEQFTERMPWLSVSYQRIYTTADGDLPAAEITFSLDIAD